MTKETHSAGGNVIAILFLSYFINKYLAPYDIEYKVVLILLYFYSSHIGSLFPDIDMKSSYISKRYPYIYKHLGKKCRHRGFTHSLLFLLVLEQLFKFVILVSESNIIFITISFGLFIGYISHLALDLFTKEGIELLFPLKFNFKIFFIKTNSKEERLIYKMLRFSRLVIVAYMFYIYVYI